MIVEASFIAALKAGLTPAAPVFGGMAPQPEGNTPAPLPVVVVNRVASVWSSTFCGTDLALAVTDLQIDFYARSNEIARRLADQGRALIAAVDPPPTLESELTTYDEASRAFRVIQTWRATDYQPAIA